MGKWIEDLNAAIDMARTSQEKSSIFLDAGLGDHSNREFFFYPVVIERCRWLPDSFGPTAEGGHCLPCFGLVCLGGFFVPH